MKAAVSLRLHPSRTEFLVFFPFSDYAVRSALLAAGVRYEATAKGYVLPATSELVARVQAVCDGLGLVLHVPPTLALAIELPPPTPHQTLLSRYCQFIALNRPKTLQPPNPKRVLANLNVIYLCVWNASLTQPI